MSSWKTGGSLFFVLAGALCAGRCQATAPDANELVRRMTALYQRATSIQDTSEARIFDNSASPYYQTTRISYQQPNRLTIIAEDPKLGGVSHYCNGLTLTIYSGRQNLYTKYTAPKNMLGILAIIERDAKQVLTPLSFVVSKGMPREAQSFRYVGTKTIEGHLTHVVSAQANNTWMKGLIPSKQVRPYRGDLVMYIDAKTNLLIRASARLLWQPSQQIGKGAKIVANFYFEETHRDTLLNAPIPESAFFFAPPKDSREIYQENR